MRSFPQLNNPFDGCDTVPVNALPAHSFTNSLSDRLLRTEWTTIVYDWHNSRNNILCICLAPTTDQPNCVWFLNRRRLHRLLCLSNLLVAIVCFQWRPVAIDVCDDVDVFGTGVQWLIGFVGDFWDRSNAIVANAPRLVAQCEKWPISPIFNSEVFIQRNALAVRQWVRYLGRFTHFNSHQRGSLANWHKHNSFGSHLMVGQWTDENFSFKIKQTYQLTISFWDFARDVFLPRMSSDGEAGTLWMMWMFQSLSKMRKISVKPENVVVTAVVLHVETDESWSSTVGGSNARWWSITIGAFSVKFFDSPVKSWFDWNFTQWIPSIPVDR